MWKFLSGRVLGRKPVPAPVQLDSSEPFPIQFERAVHRLSNDPSAPSIPSRPCFNYFGDDLLRYVPAPKIGVKPIFRLDESGNKIQGQGFLDGKNWEPLKFSLELMPQFQLARELANGIPYRETEVYSTMMAKLAEGRLQPLNGEPLNTQEKIDRYCEYVQWLIDSVRENGLRSRSEATHLFEQSFNNVRNGDKETAEKEIQIAVDANGNLLRLNTGRHRLAVAHALGIEEVPAKIHLVHVGWIVSLVRETGAKPDVALRGWLGRFKSAAVTVKARVVAAVYGFSEVAEVALVLA